MVWSRLFTNTEGGNDSPVPRNLRALEIIKHFTAFPNEFQQPLARSEIMLVGLEVTRQVINPKREECDLGFSRTCVSGGFAGALGSKNFLLFFGC